MLGGDSFASRPPSTLDSQAGPGGLEGSRLEGSSSARQDHQHCLHSFSESGVVMMTTFITSHPLSTVIKWCLRHQRMKESHGHGSSLRCTPY